MVTLTSKNQITLPAATVRMLGLGKVRRFSLEQQGKGVLLTPEVSLDDRLAAHWSKMQKHIVRPMSDGDIKQARQQYHQQRASKLASRIPS